MVKQVEPGVARILDGLNDAQREAVTHDQGPLLIVAGAGTGKTTVLTRRIAYLIAAKRCRPGEILALTFTDKAAAEMEERVDMLVPYGYADVRIATFHAFGDRLLKENALEVGLTPDFRVLNRAEQIVFFRDHLFEFPLEHYRPLGDPTRYLDAIIGLFSRAKDEDVSPEEYLAYAERLAAAAAGQAEDVELRDRAAQQLELARTYAKYRELMTVSGSIDFGDQIVYALRLFRARPYVLANYQRRFKYILVDEFQDTNYAQFELVKLLAARHNNLVVVADDDQCLPPGTPVETPTGQRPIEAIQPGDQVVTAVGKGFLGVGHVTRVFRREKHARFLTFETESGCRITTTDNHKMFCYVPRVSRSRAFTYVYLMERRDLGWRIGVTKDLSARLCLERSGDRIVGLRACRSEQEARYLETLWSLTYGIPSLPFKPRRRMKVVGEYLRRLFREVDSRKGAERLATHLGVDLKAHHFALGGVHRGGQSRVKVILTMCYRRTVPKSRGRLLKAPQVLHAVSLETSAPEVIERLRAAGVPLRRARKGWQVRTTSPSLQEIGINAEFLCDLVDGILEVRFAVGTVNVQHKAALAMPAGNVLPGHYLPIVRINRVVYERVAKVSEQFRTSEVYDLEVDRTHNFVADRVVVHNSIYKFRGAAISNVLGFKRVYLEAREIVLTENYRSPQPLLDAAYRLITHNNPDRLEVQYGIIKRLTCRIPLAQGDSGGEPVHLHFETSTQEADAVALMIERKVDSGAHRYSDFAILVRSNNDADPFLRSLNLRAIPWTFSGNQGLYGRPEVRLLIAFLRVVAHPDDSISLHYLASSDLYQARAVDLARCGTYADRKNRWLFDVMRRLEELPEVRDEVSEAGALAIQRVVKDLERYMELGRELPTGELLYQFLTDTGWLARMSKASTAREEAEVQNVSKFFRRIQGASKVLRYDNVREFVNHLDALIGAGEDPAIAEAEVDAPAVHVLTVHKAKGLEFPVVYVVGLVQNRFPWPTRRDPLELPDELIKDTLPAGDFHLQEERRLVYVAMTRAKRELYLTSARDYGGTRERKVSQFVLEALDLPKDATRPFKAHPIEEIHRFAPAAEAAVEGELALAPDDPLEVSHNKVDDYQTCPLKYKYIQVLRVPILRHHAVVYGSTLHRVVEHYLRRRAAGLYTPLEDLLGVLEREWRNEGFLTWVHEEARKQAGREAVRRFWHEEEASGGKPTHVERDFGFNLGPDHVRGRWDRVDELEEGPVIIDYKSSDVRDQRKADERAGDSLQLKIYALAWKEMFGRLPARVELRFLESGVVGRHTPTAEDVSEAIGAVKAAAAGIRARRFEATPSYQACRFCAYNQVCPFTATRE
ncbi:MAG: UvrD-helicase domain-containing protein [Candidatus Rokubacteria bacterium]|nr:UvrD-helicase domain-containing protein [Candidatus Rokubacteria bacterium]